MRTLVCVISDQQIPNFLSIKHYQVDRVILAASQAMRDIPKHLIQALSIKDPTIASKIITHDLGDSNLAFASLQNRFNCLLTAHPSDEWLINVTGGNKEMAFAALAAFQTVPNTRFLYINVDRPNTITSLFDQTSETINYDISVKEFLAAQGVVDHTQPDYRKERERKAIARWEMTQKLASRYDTTLVLESLHISNPGVSNKKIWKNQDVVLGERAAHSSSSPQLDFLRPEIRSLRPEMEKFLRLRIRDGAWYAPYRGATYLISEWLEEFFFALLHRHRDALRIRDLHLGLNVFKKVPNEFDVVFIRDLTFHKIECKVGRQGNTKHKEKHEFYYKVNATESSLGAIRTKSIVATTDPDLTPGSNTHKTTKERATSLNETLLTSEDIRNLANHCDDAEFVSKTLFPPSQNGPR
jgi:hypothetical protein